MTDSTQLMVLNCVSVSDWSMDCSTADRKIFHYLVYIGCDEHHLFLNVKKINKLIIDFRRKKITTFGPLYITLEFEDTVRSYSSKYLGVGATIDDQLNLLTRKL